MPSSATRRRVAGDRAVATISRTAPCARAARAIDEPINPTPISASRLNSGVWPVMMPALPLPIGERSASSIGREPGEGGPNDPILGRGGSRQRFASSLPQKFFECGDDQAVGFLGPYRHAQRIRQLIGGRLPQNEPPRCKEDIGILGGAPLTLRKMDQHKI